MKNLIRLIAVIGNIAEAFIAFSIIAEMLKEIRGKKNAPNYKAIQRNASINKKIAA